MLLKKLLFVLPVFCLSPFFVSGQIDTTGFIISSQEAQLENTYQINFSLELDSILAYHTIAIDLVLISGDNSQQEIYSNQFLISTLEGSQYNEDGTILFNLGTGVPGLLYSFSFRLIDQLGHNSYSYSKIITL